MKTMKKLLFFVLALLFLMGCQAKPATDDTDSDDFQWILVRDNGGTWEVKTYGYG